MEYLLEPAKKLPVWEQADLFVAGGSCTGVFAAVRAARLGLKVVLAERQNCLGGMATAAMVCVWHSLKDAAYQEQIIAGLTQETVWRLEKAGAAWVQDDPSLAVQFNPFRLQYELDRLIQEEKITLYLHTLCASVLVEQERITAAVLENKDGRGAIKAHFFIDATGDGDMARELGLPAYRREAVQPPTPCFLMRGTLQGVEMERLIQEHGVEFGLEDDFGWSTPVPGMPDEISLQAPFHVLGVDCASAQGLTKTETEGRRKAYALVDLLRRYTGRDFSVAALSSLAGVRESNHYPTRTQVKGWDLLLGNRCEDAVLNGTYRVDMHDKDGRVTFYYLNGTALSMEGAQRHTTQWDWRKEHWITQPPARYYQAPFSMLVQERYSNFIPVGRMLHGDDMAFGALRVMVNLNQMGEAAGVAAYLSVDSNTSVDKLDGKQVRQLLRKGGSVL